MICCEIKSYQNPQERLFYDGIEKSAEKQRMLQKKFKELYPFQPNMGKQVGQPKTLISEEKINELANPRRSRKESFIRLLNKERLEVAKERPLFVPKINKYNPEVFRQAKGVKIAQEIRDQSKQLERKMKTVFNFFSLNQPVLRIQQFDSLNTRNECILMFSNILIALIHSKNNLNFDEFVDLVVGKNLLSDIDQAYDYINESVNPSEKRERARDATRSPNSKIRRTESDVTKMLQTDFDKKVRELYKLNEAALKDQDYGSVHQIPRKATLQAFR